jgi:hypothetical protein
VTILDTILRACYNEPEGLRLKAARETHLERGKGLFLCPKTAREASRREDTSPAFGFLIEGANYGRP